jgi:hypothetical protein
MDINDIVKGTPSNADTVLPRKFPAAHKTDSSDLKLLPREFQTR